jgi:hypothetical protein
MSERRAAVRKRVMYGAIAAMPGIGDRKCIVKNLSDVGARVEFSEPANLCDDLAFTVPQTGLSCRARIVWVRENVAGLAFTSAPASVYQPREDVEQKLEEIHKRVSLMQRGVHDLLGEA